MPFATIPPTLQLIRESKVRAIAVTGAQRSTALADVPTVAESGLPGYESVLWQAIYAPAGTPAAIVSRLNTEVNTILHERDAVDALAKLGVEAQPARRSNLPSASQSISRSGTTSSSAPASSRSNAFPRLTILDGGDAGRQYLAQSA